MKAVMVAGAVVLVATILNAGFFTVVPLQGSGVYVVNKYTGSVTHCAGPACRDAMSVPNK